MKRPPSNNAIQTYENIVSTPGAGKHLFAQLLRLSQRKAHIEKKVRRYQYLANEGRSELQLIDSVMGKLLDKVQS